MSKAKGHKAQQDEVQVTTAQEQGQPQDEAQAATEQVKVQDEPQGQPQEEAQVATDKDRVVKGRKGAGWRYCEPCDHSTMGPNSQNCGNCGKAFPQSNRNRSKGKAQDKAQPQAKTVSMVSVITNHLATVKELGGLEQVQDMIKSAELLQKLGGLDEAKQIVDMVKQLTDIAKG